MMGFMTGNKSGVSTVALLVLSLPILASRSFSFVSKYKGQTLAKTNENKYKNVQSHHFKNWAWLAGI
jgi:hypothetical protein